jgi:hypothetical protein
MAVTENLTVAVEAIEKQISMEWESMLESIKERDTFQMEESIRKVDDLHAIINSIERWQ